MKLLSAVVIISLGLLVKPVMADDAGARALAAKLIDMTNGKETMKAGFQTVMNGVIDNMAQHGLPQAGVDEIRAAVSQWYDAEINFSEIEPKIVDIYVKDFSEDELKQIVAFYASPVGQKAIKNMPEVMKDGAMAAQDYTKAKIPSLNAKLMPILTKYRDQAAAASGGSGGGGMPQAPAPGTPGNP